jgi:acyl-coenzyme A thioesterase PaaI-like protein
MQIGVASAWFVTGRSEGLTLRGFPWEEEFEQKAPKLRRQDLDARERDMLARALSAARRVHATGGSFSEELLDVDWLPSRETQAKGRFTLRHEFLNRRRAISGGVAFGLVEAASRRATGNGFGVAHGTMHYLRPASGRSLQVSAHVLRRGSRAAFVEARIRASGAVAAIATFMLMAAPSRQVITAGRAKTDTVGKLW